MTLRAVDLFCGVGGFAWGMHKAGITIIRSMDHDPDVLKVHRRNLKNFRTDLLQTPIPARYRPKLTSDDGTFRRGQVHESRAVPHVADLTALINMAPEIALDAPDIIFGGPPCQAFSNSGKKEKDDDLRSQLTEAYAVMVAAARPKYFVMENVKGLRKSETFKRAVAVFRRAGYGLTETVVKASYFGTAQARERLILAGCLDESDGWFNAYLNQYKTAEERTVEDLFGPEFGTPLADFLLDPDCEDAVDQNAQADYNGYRLRDRDLKRLQAEDVTSDTRFYHTTPGGESSAAIQPVKKPAMTIIRTSAHDLPKTYRPIKGDPVDLRRLYHPTFEEFSRIGGFPEEWKWPSLSSDSEPAVDETEFRALSRQRLLMLANCVPPPLAHAIGKAILDHHQRKVPVAPIENNALEAGTWKIGNRQLNRYRKWLRVAKGLEGRELIQEISDLRSAMKLLAGHKLETAKEAREAFEKLSATGKSNMGGSRRSQLRRALRNRADFELYFDYVTVRLFPDDDEAYRRGDFHAMLDPSSHDVPDEYDEVEREDFRRRAALIDARLKGRSAAVEPAE